MHAELRVAVLHVRANRVQGEPELLGHALPVEPGHQALQDRHLSRGQSPDAALMLIPLYLRTLQLSQEAAEKVRWDHALPVDRSANGCTDT